MSDNIIELGVEEDQILTLEEVKSMLDRRGISDGLVVYFDENGSPSMMNFGSPTNEQALWMAMWLVKFITQGMEVA